MVYGVIFGAKAVCFYHTYLDGPEITLEAGVGVRASEIFGNAARSQIRTKLCLPSMKKRVNPRR